MAEVQSGYSGSLTQHSRIISLALQIFSIIYLGHVMVPRVALVLGNYIALARGIGRLKAHPPPRKNRVRLYRSTTRFVRDVRAVLIVHNGYFV